MPGQHINVAPFPTKTDGGIKNMTLTDIIALAKQGYKPGDIKELIEIAKTAEPEDKTEPPVEPPAEPEDKTERQKSKN